MRLCESAYHIGYDSLFFAGKRPQKDRERPHNEQRANSERTSKNLRKKRPIIRFLYFVRDLSGKMKIIDRKQSFSLMQEKTESLDIIGFPSPRSDWIRTSGPHVPNENFEVSRFFAVSRKPCWMWVPGFLLFVAFCGF